MDRKKENELYLRSILLDFWGTKIPSDRNLDFLVQRILSAFFKVLEKTKRTRGKYLKRSNIVIVQFCSGLCIREYRVCAAKRRSSVDSTHFHDRTSIDKEECRLPKVSRARNFSNHWYTIHGKIYTYAHGATSKLGNRQL